MKKIIILASILILMLSSIVYAWDWEKTVPVAWKSVVVENDDDTNYVWFSIPTTTIRPNKSILGYAIILMDGHSESIVGFYDGVGGASIVSDELFDEAEADEQNSKPMWYPYPRKILTQLNLMVGPNTRVIVYWE